MSDGLCCPNGWLKSEVEKKIKLSTEKTMKEDIVHLGERNPRIVTKCKKKIRLVFLPNF